MSEAPGEEGGVTFSGLSPFNSFRYAPLTFSEYRPLIQSFTHAKFVAGSCASVDGKPVGLAVARVDPFGTAVVLSIYVVRECRRRGIGTELLRRLEQDLAARGQTAAVLCYASERTGSVALERLLLASGWPMEGDRQHFFTMDCTILSSAVGHAVLPDEFEISSWSTVTPGERTALVDGEQADPWIPADLAPFRFEHDLELNSLVLRRRREIVGWVITQPFTPTAIHYASLFVKPSVNKVGRTFASLALLGESVRRQARALGLESRGLFEVAPDNLPFLRFIDRHLSGYVLEHVEKQRRIKRLHAESHPLLTTR